MTSRPTPLVDRAGRALAAFFRLEAAGGFMLMAAAAFALLLANSALAPWYESLRAMPVEVRAGSFHIAKPLLLWINDGLMAIFFLLVALELKRERLTGQLAGREQMVLPMACAAAGVLLPALIYYAFNRGDEAALRGWAVPAATDIAFALGVLSLLGSRVPTGMKLLLSTIAVVDDLIAIVIIAVFYSTGLSPVALGGAAVALAGMVVLNRRGITALTPYLVLGVLMWVFVLKSGVHATLAGVATGLMIPHVNRHDALDDETQHSPLETLEHALHPWVAYAILPLFAFANAGLALGGLSWADLRTGLPLGIALGLVFGKTVGIALTALGLRAVGWAPLPAGMTPASVVGLAMLCGIGFTMSLFIASLAYAESSTQNLAVAGVLAGSLVSAVLGYAWLLWTLPKAAT
jgi:NhaA family Na+:H+ antiporter